MQPNFNKTPRPKINETVPMEDADEAILRSITKKYGKMHEKDFFSNDYSTYFKYVPSPEGDESGSVKHQVIKLPSFAKFFSNFSSAVEQIKLLRKNPEVIKSENIRELFDQVQKAFRRTQFVIRKEFPVEYEVMKRQRPLLEVNYKVYKEKHFDICPAAEALRDRLLNGEFGDPNEHTLGEWLYQHDILFGTEKQVIQDKEGDRNDLRKAANAAKSIINLSRDLNIPSKEINAYIPGHLKKIRDIVNYSSLTEALDHNDPVLMRARAAKMRANDMKKLDALKKTNIGFNVGPTRKEKNARALVQKLKAKRAEIEREMENDPDIEPTGGPVADMYGDQLNKIDNAIEKAASVYSKPMDYDTAVGKVSEDDDYGKTGLEPRTFVDPEDLTPSARAEKMLKKDDKDVDKINEEEVEKEGAELPDATDEMLQKFPTLKKTIVRLMTDDYKEFMETIDYISPRPTAFKINLTNGQSFTLKWMGKNFEATILGKRYYLGQLNNYQQALDKLSILYKEGPISSDTGEPGEVPSDDFGSDLGGGSAGGGADLGAGDAAPAADAGDEEGGADLGGEELGFEEPGEDPGA